MRTGTVCPLTMGIPTPAPRPFLSRSAVSGSAGRSCRKSERWKRRFSGIRTRNAAPYADKPFSQNPTGGNTARTAPPEFTGGRKQKVNGKGGLLWTVKAGKSLDLQGSASPKTGRAVFFIAHTGKRASNCPQNTI